ncbi:MAG: ABC transporter permease [Myxococcota bacterium]
MSAAIPNQVRLPLRVAVGVVAQGIRIRLGRSLVTITGVVLGVAFLTSIISAQALRRSVAAEDRLREAASRAYGYLAAETGPVFGKKLGLVFVSAPSPVESRLLSRLEREGVAELRVFGAPSVGEALDTLQPRRVQTSRELGADASAILIVGSGALPSLDFEAAFSTARQRVLALSNERAPVLDAPSGVQRVQLARPLPAEERARLAEAERREHFRGLWIIAISLLVTVIGIANSMLMSVTERFRDIGTMKCLGAESGFIRRIFLIEASFMGVVGGALGVLLGNVFAWGLTLAVYGPRLTLHASAEQLGSLAVGGLVSLLLGVALSVLASLYPAQFAARMVPAAALRSNV